MRFVIPKPRKIDPERLNWRKGMSEKQTSPLPWIPSQYMDTDEWGILNQQNEIMVGISSRLTKERAQFICRAVNTHAALVEALKKISLLGPHSTHSCANLGKLEPECSRCIATRALRQAEEGK